MIEVTASRLSAEHRVRAWLRAAAMRSSDPLGDWRVVHVGSKGSSAVALHLSVAEHEHALRVLALADDLYWRARSGAFPAAAKLTFELHHAREAAAGAWQSTRPGFGLVDDRWIGFVFAGATLDDVLALPPTDAESDPAWGTGASRLERWAHRIWTEFHATITHHEASADGAAEPPRRSA